VGVLRDGGPPLAPAPGLDQLDGLVAQAEGAGLDVRVEVAGAARALPRAVDLAAYRIVQEALTNVLRHSGAISATVALRWDSGALELVVDDDGRGPVTPRLGRGPGHGLLGMHERASALGGTLSAGPAPTGGFRVSARLPVP